MPAPSRSEPSLARYLRIKTSFTHKSIVVKMQSYGILHLKRKENSMSSSDDYHRHRLRTATKYFKVSVKPFQRLAECEAEPHEKNAYGVRGDAPRKSLKKKRKVNGNPTRRPPARLIANYKVF